MIRFWKMKKMMATGMVMIAAAASFSGYWVPALSCPEESCATPLVRVVSAGSWVETNEVAELVPGSREGQDDDCHDRGNDIGRTIDQNVRKVPAPSTFACLTRRSFFMM